jgi:thiol-disulfide isomerase/thioredoxin
MGKKAFFIVVLGAASLMLASCVYMQAMTGGTVLGATLFSKAIEERNRPKPLADFSVTLFDGQQKTVWDFTGKPLVVNFWADWCPPCVGELPEFQAVYNEHHGEFEILGIAAESSKDAEGFVKQNGYTWTFGRAAGGFDAYQVRGIPTTLFVNSDGYVIDQVVGGMDRATFEAKLAKIL